MTLLLLLRQKERQNSEIRMTASVLKQDPNTKGSEECYLLGQSTTCASFRGKSMRDLCKRRRHGVWEGGGCGGGGGEETDSDWCQSLFEIINILLIVV